MQAATSCAGADSSAAAKAVLDYITTVEPKPLRFLSAVGTDSAVPEDAFRVLQDKGPTFFYAGSDDAKQKLREKLENDGPYASMLVVMRENRTADDAMSAEVTLAGHYIANADHGKTSPPRTYRFGCDAGVWVRADTMTVTQSPGTR